MSSLISLLKNAVRSKGDRESPSKLVTSTTLVAKSSADSGDAFVFGLRYATPLQADTRQNELKQFTALHAAERSAYIAIKAIDSRSLFLMAAGSFKQEKGISYHAGAAAICQHNKGTERTYVIQLGNDIYVAFQAAANGLLAVGSEVVGSAEAVTKTMHSWQSDRSLGSIYFLLDAASSLIELVTNGLGATARRSDLLNFKPSPNTQLEKPKVPYAKFAVIGVACAALAVFGSLKGTEYLQKLNVEKNDQAAAELKRANYLRQVKQTITSSWTGTHQDVYESVVLPLMTNVNIKRVGFKVAEVVCEIQQRSCSTKFQRVSGTYFELLSTTTPNMVSLTEDYNEIRLIETADFDKAKKPPPAFTSFPKRKSFLLDVGDILSEFKLAGMATAGPLDKGGPIVPWSGADKPPPVPLVGKVSLKGDIGLINAMLAMPGNTTPTKLTLTAGKGTSFSFTLESTYYVSPDN